MKGQRVVRFPDSSLAVVASWTTLGEVVFEGSATDCASYLEKNARQVNGLWIAGQASPKQEKLGGRTRETVSKRCFDTRSLMDQWVKPILPEYFGLNVDAWYCVERTWTPQYSALVHVGFEGTKALFPWYATPDLQPAFQLQEDWSKGVPPAPLEMPKSLGPLRAGEWVRPLGKGTPGLDHTSWYNITSLYQQHFGHESMIKLAGQDCYYRWVDEQGLPMFERWWEVHRF